MAVQGGTTIILLLLIGIFTGRNTLSGMIPTNTLILVITIVALVISAAMAIPPVRHIVTEKYLPIVKSYARSLVNVLSHPKELAFGILGALILNISTGLGFWIALMAFGCPHQSGGDHIHLPAGEYARFRSADTRAALARSKPRCPWPSPPWASPPPSPSPLLSSTESPSIG